MATKEKKRASALVVTVIILGLILTIALGTSVISVLEKKVSSSSNKSNVAYQKADAGVERALALIKKNETGEIADIDANCDGKIEDADGNYKIELQDRSGEIIQDCEVRVSSIKSIKSIGMAAGNQRVVKVAVAASSFDCHTETAETTGQNLTKDCEEGTLLSGTCMLKSGGSLTGDKLDSDGYTCETDGGSGLDVYIMCCE
jgi:hypothetical protein